MQTNLSTTLTYLKKHATGKIGLWLIIIFSAIGLYAPLLASSQPIFVLYNYQPYFPLFRYLFFLGYFTKKLDIFFNLLIFSAPAVLFIRHKIKSFYVLPLGFLIHCLAFLLLILIPVSDPASDLELNIKKQTTIQSHLTQNNNDPLLSPIPFQPSWEFELEHMNTYAQLELVTKYVNSKRHDEKIQSYIPESTKAAPTIWQLEQGHLQDIHDRHQKIVVTLWDEYPKALQKWETFDPDEIQNLNAVEKSEFLNAKAIVTRYEHALKKLDYLHDKEFWLETQSEQIHWMVMPLIRPFHWEDDAGGEQALNQFLPWWELTRTNRKDLTASLLFGIRVSLVVGLASVGIALLIGIPIGAAAGYYGGKFDIIVSRLLEIWEGMPVLFMLLLTTSILQNRSIFLVIAVIGLFGWTGISRFIRAEFLKQRHLPYVEACQVMGFKNPRIIFSHILPNAIPPVLTLLPFSIMAAITSEAGLSFLGLGEPGSCSWGVLMDEGREAFPGESYLLWPPASMLTVLLIAIALLGDALRDALDPRLKS